MAFYDQKERGEKIVRPQYLLGTGFWGGLEAKECKGTQKTRLMIGGVYLPTGSLGESGHYERGQEGKGGIGGGSDGPWEGAGGIC